MKKIILNLYLLLIILISFSFVRPSPSSAAILFQDNFDGNGELSQYNATYQKVETFNLGEMTVNNGLVEATGFDPSYVYTGISDANKCASINFNWSNGGNWTAIMFKSLPGIGGKWSSFNVHGGDGKWFIYSNSGQSQSEGTISIDYSATHTLKACVSGNTIKGYLDGNLIATAVDNESSGYFGFASQIGTKSLDNFRIEDNTLSDNINLNVPLLKQTSQPWKNHVYNSANLWNPSDPTINSFGCAMTSAAMVFKFHGINKLPNNKDLDPGTLNTWLKQQKDGYIGNGLTNWLALSRLSRQAKNINNLSYNALEYKRFSGNAQDKLNEILSANHPGILEVPGHFIVGKGTNDGIFTISDPYYSRNDLSSYGNTFKNLGVFTKSNTDLSYIMLTVGLNTDIEVFDSNNNPVGELFIEEGVSNPTDNSQTTGELRIVHIPKPASGNYKIILGNSGEFQLKTYIYDKSGEVFIKTDKGTIVPEQNKEIILNFSSDTNLYPKKVTYLSTALDIAIFRKLKLLDSKAIKNLEGRLALAFVQSIKGNEEKENKILSDLEEYLSENSDKFKESSYSTLLYDINYLSSH